MRRLYLATKELDVMFISDKDLSVDAQGVKVEAVKFIEEEIKVNLIFDAISSIREIKSYSEVPEKWRDAFLWGTEDEETPADFLHKKSKNSETYREYLEAKEAYLRLKDIYE